MRGQKRLPRKVQRKDHQAVSQKHCEFAVDLSHRIIIINETHAS